MAEGAMNAWKVQKLNCAPTIDYKDIIRPLGPPPRNMKWVRDDDTREWSLQPIQQLEQQQDCEEKQNDCEDSEQQGGGGGQLLIEHVVTPSDTFQGICLKYKVSPTKLRQLNNFSGTSLTYAPDLLIVPSTRLAICNNNYDKQQQTVKREDTRAHRLQVMRKTFHPTLSTTELKAYLEINDWDLNAAMDDARSDLEFEANRLLLLRLNNNNHNHHHHPSTTARKCCRSSSSSSQIHIHGYAAAAAAAAGGEEVEDLQFTTTTTSSHIDDKTAATVTVVAVANGHTSHDEVEGDYDDDDDDDVLEMKTLLKPLINSR